MVLFNGILLILFKLNLFSEITITIKGRGNQQIINNVELEGNRPNYMPDKILINGQEQEYTNNIVYNLTDEENDITMIMNYQVTNCIGMFYSMTNITKIDLSKFDSSQVTRMSYMFYDCISLTSLDLTNFTTELVRDMKYMFYNCKSLELLDLSNFKTSLVNTMENMFSLCISLKSLNLSNFDTSSVLNMNLMFSSCKNIKSIDLSSFNTKNVNNMMQMFDHCISLISIDLSSFDTNKVKDMSLMFNHCNSLISLNLNNFNTPSDIKTKSMFDDCKTDLIYCINEENNTNIINELSSVNANYTNDCSHVCFNKLKTIRNIESNPFCFLDCIYTDKKFEYNNQCYTKCPINTHYSFYDNFLCEKDDNDNSDNNDNNSNNNDNNDPEKTIINIYNIININDTFLENLKKEFKDGSLDELISNTIFVEKKDIIIKDNNILYQITSTYNQNNNEYNNISTIDLGTCENKLIENYGFNENESILILKMDYYEEGLLIPIIEYELYNNITKEKLDLIICQEEKINISIPVEIDEEEELFKYNSSSDYYNDICFTYTTNNKTDITLEDRRNEYTNNNMSLCEVNCEYDGYNTETQQSLCSCQIKINFPLVSEIVINKDKLLNNFIDINTVTNLYTMKCIKLLFSKEGLINNIGSYTLLAIILLYIILAIIFKIKGFKLLKNSINEILKKNIKNETIKDMNKNKNNILKKKRSNSFTKLNQIENKNEDSNNKGNNNNQKSKLKDNPPKTKIKDNNQRNPEIKRKNKNAKTIINGGINISVMNLNCNNNSKTNSNFNLNNHKKQSISSLNKNINIFGLNKTNKNIKKYTDKKIDVIEYNNYELNWLNYKEALKKDKRTFIQYYISLLKSNQIFIFTFFADDDYNSNTIKLSLFLFSFSVYYAVNAIFFNDSTMHKIYEDEGSYDFIYQIPQILYSTIISTTINILVKLISLSEKSILEIKKIRTKKNKYKEISKIRKCLIVKLILFYLITFLFLIFFWFYISSFCAVYKNTQNFLIEDTLISFGLSSFYSFGLSLLPSALRIHSLKACKKNKECMYKFSKILQII